jgi:hypothetical protein
VGVLDASTSPPKERYAVSKDNVIKLIQPGNLDDQLTEILRDGARALLAQAAEAEVTDFLGKHAYLKTATVTSAWPKTREQRCWVLKTANVIAKLPKSQQPKAKRALQEIWMAETNIAAKLAFDAFIESYMPAKAADCLSKDRDTLLAFYDFPAEHWNHLRTTNPIESTFAIVRHRTIRSKGCLSNRTALAMGFKLLEAAQKSWRRLDGHNQLPKLILDVTFNDGIEVIKPTDRQPTTAAA